LWPEAVAGSEPVVKQDRPHQRTGTHPSGEAGTAVADVATPDPRAGDTTAVATRSHRRRAWFLLAFAVWNVWVWATRLVNLIGDGETHSAAFIAVHVILYIGGFGGAAVLTVMGTRMLRESRRTTA
jgi:hypothetical protein